MEGGSRFKSRQNTAYPDKTFPVEFEVFTAVVMKSIIFWDYFFGPAVGGDMFLRNVGCNSTDYTASHSRR
jgi:hypothetical protein